MSIYSIKNTNPCNLFFRISKISNWMAERKQQTEKQTEKKHGFNKK